MTWKYFKWLWKSHNVLNYYKYIIKIKKLFKKAIWYECSYIIHSPDIRGIGKSFMLESLSSKYNIPILTNYKFKADSVDLHTLRILMKNKIILIDDVKSDLATYLINNKCIVIGFYTLSDLKGVNDNVWIKTPPFIQK